MVKESLLKILSLNRKSTVLEKKLASRSSSVNSGTLAFYKNSPRWKGGTKKSGFFDNTGLTLKMMLRELSPASLAVPFSRQNSKRMKTKVTHFYILVFEVTWRKSSLNNMIQYIQQIRSF